MLIFYSGMQSDSKKKKKISIKWEHDLEKSLDV